jgi:hypothetical protein
MLTIGEIVGDPYLDSEEFKKLPPIHKRWYYELPSYPLGRPDWTKSQEAINEHMRKVKATLEFKKKTAP